MNPAYAPKTPTGRLDRLIEEIGEVSVEAGALLKAIAKGRRFGMDSRHPDGGPTNREDALDIMGRLRSELLDLLGAMDHVETDMIEHAADGARNVVALPGGAA